MTLAVLWAVACGKSGQPTPALPAPAPAKVAPARDAADYAGHYRWSFVSEVDGVRRIEQEYWHIESSGRAVTGTCARTITFLAVDGTPFLCNQTLGYELLATYQLQGTLTERGVELTEIDYQAAPSPCEPERRELTRYTAERSPRGLRLRWPGGEQTLVKTPLPAPAPLAKNPLSHPYSGSLSGPWQWQTRSQQGSEIRVEIEDWLLSETPAGELTGTVERTVTVFDADGRRYPCSDNTYYRYQDRIVIRGRRSGQGITVTELDVTTDSHPCLEHETRHLDTATGHITGDYIVLLWRGKRRQVLHAPLPHRLDNQ